MHQLCKIPHTTRLCGDCAKGTSKDALRILHFVTISIPKVISTRILTCDNKKLYASYSGKEWVEPQKVG